EHFSKAAAKARASRVVERKFACRQQPHRGHGVYRALRVDVESSDRFDFLIEQIDTKRQRTPHRIEIDQSSANAEFAGGNHLRHVLVTGEGELCAQGADVERLSLREKESKARKIGRWREPIERGRRS